MRKIDPFSLFISKQALYMIEVDPQDENLRKVRVGDRLLINPTFVFDFDGTLARTKREYLSMFLKILRDLGKEVKPAELEKVMGGRMREVLSNFLKGDELEIALRKARSGIKSIAKKIKLRKGAKKVLGILRKIGKIYLVSNSNRDFIESVLKRNRILGFFGEIFPAERKESKEEVIRKIQRENKGMVFYIGDMVRDVKIAKKANSVSIAIPGWDKKSQLKKAKPDFLINDLEEILMIL